MRQDVDLTADDLRELDRVLPGDLRARGARAVSRRTRREQLRRATRAVFDSWDSPRAKVYRRAYEIPDDLGTAVNVVQMVFGNKGDTSGTGVCFTRNPSTGERRSSASSWSTRRARTSSPASAPPSRCSAWRSCFPEAYDELVETLGGSRSTTARCRTSSSRSRTERSSCSRRAPASARRGGTADRGRDDGEELISREEAVARIDPGQLDQLLHPMIDPSAEVEVVATGLNASPGAASGAIVLDADIAEERGSAGEDVILVRWETTPDDIHGLIHARGVLTAHGGMTSHAAVVARGMGKPCVAGCDALSIDTKARRSGSARSSCARATMITIDGGTGRRDRRLRAARAARDRRELRDDPRLGRRAASASRPRERRHAGGRGEGAGVRRRGHRPLPHRAHVHGARPAAGRPGDDPRLEREGATRGARPAAARAAGRLRRDLRGDGRATR